MSCTVVCLIIVCSCTFLDSLFCLYFHTMKQKSFTQKFHFLLTRTLHCNSKIMTAIIPTFFLHRTHPQRQKKMNKEKHQKQSVKKETSRKQLWEQAPQSNTKENNPSSSFSPSEIPHNTTRLNRFERALA